MLSQLNPVHRTELQPCVPQYYSHIYFYVFLKIIQLKISYKFLIYPMHTTCIAHLILPNLFTITIFGAEYNYKVFHCVIFSVLLLLFLSSKYSPLAPSIYRLTLRMTEQVSHPYKKQVN
jgi:hypothetical protein